MKVSHVIKSACSNFKRKSEQKTLIALYRVISHWKANFPVNDDQFKEEYCSGNNNEEYCSDNSNLTEQSVQKVWRYCRLRRVSLLALNRSLSNSIQFASIWTIRWRPRLRRHSVASAATAGQTEPRRSSNSAQLPVSARYTWDTIEIDTTNITSLRILLRSFTRM